MMRAKRGRTSYAGVSKEWKRGEDDRKDRETCDYNDKWFVQTSRMERRRERERERSCNEERRPPANEGQRERLPRTRNRPEAVLIKFREGGKWLQTYKEHMLARLCVKA